MNSSPSLERQRSSLLSEAAFNGVPPAPTSEEQVELEEQQGQTPRSPAAECKGQAQAERAESTSSTDKDMKIKSKMARLTGEVRNQLKHALRDSSDWHPRLNEEVAKVTDINTRIVRSRIYVTSASTMHSLVNILRHGHIASGDDGIISNLGKVIDLNYLTHIVLRCYELDEPPSQSSVASAPGMSESERRKSKEKARYRVEISMSPGVQVMKDGSVVQWPQGSEFQEEFCKVAPLEIIADSVELSRIERFLTETVKVYGAQPNDEEEDDEKPSDND